LLVAKNIKPNIINTGDKIMFMEVKQEFKIRFIDSLNFIQMKLKDFPKTFDIHEVKGYFPHKFNIPENYDYIGPHPSPPYYGTESMTKKDRLEFMEWYKTVKDGTFNFQEQMYNYCKADVDVLRQSCILFRELFIKIANIDPFQYITIAGVCKAILCKRVHRRTYCSCNR
jgi:DNA polymerase type B, organellar and viral